MSVGSIADRQVFWNFLMVNRLLTACCALWSERCFVSNGSYRGFGR